MKCQIVGFLLILFLFASAPAASAATVDPALVGTWEMIVPNPQGVARWVWEIRANGTYSFHAEGPGNVPAHSGTFDASKGKYTLKSTNTTWSDNGTYDIQATNMLQATGKLGSGWWRRVQPGEGQFQAGPSGAHDLPKVTLRDGVPANLPGYLESVRSVAHGWRNDALLVEISVDVGRWTNFRYYSPGNQHGLDLSPDAASGYQVRYIGGGGLDLQHFERGQGVVCRRDQRRLSTRRC